MKKKERENEETTTKETLRFHRGEWLRSFEKRRLLDLSQFTGRIRFEGSPSKKVPKSPSLPLSLGKMMPRLPQQLTDEIKTKSALEPSFPHPPSSYATNCVLTSPTQVYFTKLLNHRFPEAHYNVFHGCIISPLPTPRLSSEPYSLPNRLSSPLPTRCLSRLHVFMNSGASEPTQVFHKSKTSPENPEEWAAKRKEDSEKETEGSL